MASFVAKKSASSPVNYKWSHHYVGAASFSWGELPACHFLLIKRRTRQASGTTELAEVSLPLENSFLSPQTLDTPTVAQTPILAFKSDEVSLAVDCPAPSCRLSKRNFPVSVGFNLHANFRYVHAQCSSRALLRTWQVSRVTAVNTNLLSRLSTSARNLLPVARAAAFSVVALLAVSGWGRVGFAEGQSAGAPAAAAGQKPNILVIVADDLGYGELGCQGWKDIPTPHIDSIARNGVRFTSGYVSCPVCSPTRAGLMTGRYQQRFGHEFNPGPVELASDTFGLRATKRRWPSGSRRPAMRPVSSANGTSERGKDFGPPNGGSTSSSASSGARILISPTAVAAARSCAAPSGSWNPTTSPTPSNAKPSRLSAGTTPSRSSCTWPSTPCMPRCRRRPNTVARFPGIEDQKRQTFAGMLSAMDDAVGAVLAQLHDLGLEEKTLVFFISDNGGPTPQTTSRNDPLRGTKATTWEGGIRIPFMIQWKGHVPPGKVDERPVISLDIHPTALAAAGVGLPTEKKLDGVNLLPFLEGSSAALPHEFLFWRFGAQMAVRKGDWKITRAVSRPEGQRRRRAKRSAVGAALQPGSGHR